MGRVLYLDQMRATGGGGGLHINLPEWYDRALCPQVDNEPFFPEKGGSTREAKKVCLSCEVREECLQYALDNDERYGIWGGFSERERRKLKKQRGLPASNRAGRRHDAVYTCGAPATHGPCNTGVREEGARCARHPRSA